LTIFWRREEFGGMFGEIFEERRIWRDFWRWNLRRKNLERFLTIFFEKKKNLE
jgi:hypothetical protein